MKVATLTLVATLILGMGMGAVLVPDLLLARYPATDLRVSGGLTTDARREIETTLATMSLDLTSGALVKARLDAAPWVHHVNVRVAWPDRLDVEVMPQRPVALWNADEFLNEAGEAFRSPYYDRKLPQLLGPAEHASEVMAQFRELATMLGETGQTIETLQRDQVGRWEFESSSGVRVLLGRSDTFARMRRLVRVMQSEGFANRAGEVLLVDARYAHGLAVRYDDDVVAEEGGGQTSGSVPAGLARNNMDTDREMSL